MIVKAVAELSDTATLISVPSALIESSAISPTLVIALSLKDVAPNDIVPVAVKLLDPTSIAPNPLVIEPLFNAPTVVTFDNVITNGSTIGHTDDTDLMTVADGILTVAGEVSMTTLDIGGTNVTATAAELNHSDGVTSAIQTQLDAKGTKGFSVAMGIVFG